MKKVIIAGLCLTLPACATPQSTQVVDTFCLTVKKRSWSIDDTPKTVADAEAWNTAIDRACRKQRIATAK